MLPSPTPVGASAGKNLALVTSSFSTPAEQHTVELLNERLDSWQLTLSTVIDYFTEISRCEQVLSRSHQKLATSLVQTVANTGISSAPSSPRSDSSSSRSNFWLGPLQAFSLQTASGSESLYKFVKEETLGRLEALRDDFCGKAKDIRDRLGKIQRHLGREQEALLKAMKEHERLSRSRVGSNESGEDRDVWLAELSLHGQIECFLGEKSRFCTALQELYSSVRVLHAECARSLSATMAEHFTVKGKQTLAAGELLKDVASGLAAVEPEAEWHAALVRARLDYEWSLEAPPLDGFTGTVLHAVSPGGEARPAKVLRSGFLLRPGSTFGPAWTTVFCVLTDSHWLHGYAPESKKRPRKNGEVSPEPSYIVPQPDDELARRQLSEMNTAISAAWLGFLHSDAPRLSKDLLRIDARLLEPVFSIALSEGVSVAIDASSSTSGYSWSVHVPGGTGFFSRSERRYVFRSWVEDDMVDWCIALKDEIAASVAQPAEPADEPSPSPRRPSSWADPADDSVEPSVIAQPVLSPPITTATPSTTISSDSAAPLFNLENPWGQ